MIVRDLRPEPKIPFPQCQSLRADKYCSDIKGVANQCQRNATIEIDGKFMCRPHAGKYALALLLEEESTK